MDRNEAEQLLERYLTGNCTDDERRLVEAWFNQELRSRKLSADIDWETAKAAVWKRVEPHKRQNVLTWLPYVAAVLVATAMVAWYFSDNLSSEGSGIAVTQEADIAPGGNRATLTLADGRTITLDEARSGVVVGNGEITYSDGNPLVSVEGRSERKAAIPILKLSTPKGGTYQITLPDGTRVWLNAASTLKYPSLFAGDARVVELEGEAYFDVAQVRKDENSPGQPRKVSQQVPFKVVTTGQTIEVVGTVFNISAYADDHETKTTLVAGKVRVQAMVQGLSGASAPVSELEPGEQAITRGSAIEINEVDIFDYTAWREGIIVLNGAQLGDVMRQLARWYDVAFDVPALKTNKTAYVIINRNENLSSVLKALEETYQVKLKLEGRRVGLIE